MRHSPPERQPTCSGRPWRRGHAERLWKTFRMRGRWEESTSGMATSPGSPPSLHVSHASGCCTPSSTLKRPSIGLLNAFISRRQGGLDADRVHPGPAFQRDVLDAAERRPPCLDMDQALVVPIHPHVDVPDHSCTVGRAGTATDRCRRTCPRLGITPPALAEQPGFRAIFHSAAGARRRGSLDNRVTSRGGPRVRSSQDGGGGELASPGRERRPAPVRPPRAHGGRCRRRPPARRGNGHGDARSPGAAVLRCERRRLRPSCSWQRDRSWRGGSSCCEVVGGYAREVFGAGTEEYKRIIRASLLCAGLVGIGCYLTKLPSLARILPPRLRHRNTAHRPGSRDAEASHPAGQGGRPPPREAHHRRGPDPRRRGGGRATPRVVAGVHGAGSAHRARCTARGRPPPASRSSATPTRRRPSSRSRLPRSSCSPKARSGPARSSGGRPGSWKDCPSSRSSYRA